MDHFYELAQHPDIHEALTLATASTDGAVAAAAIGLRAYDFLFEEHRTIWTAEVVNAFYAHPGFAAETWVLLRYCRTSRLALAKCDSSPTAAGAMRAAEALAPLDDGEPPRRRGDCAERMKRVDELCAEHGLPVDPPAFVAAVLDAFATPSNVYEQECRALLTRVDELRTRAKACGVAVPFSVVLDAELEQIAATRRSVARAPSRHWDARNERRGTQLPLRAALDANLFGLAFSGGGIRSATFNLGILQALSRIGLLRHVDYLSTVSGGGYIGSWLAAWIRRESTVGGTKQPSGLDTMLEMQRRLSPSRSPNPMDDRVRPLRFLREYSNYLTPRSGFFSADTWTMLGIYLRNTLLNQIILVACLAVLLLVPRLWMTVAAVGTHEAPLVGAGLCWLVGVLFLLGHLRTLKPAGKTVVPVGDTGAKRVPRRRWSSRVRPATVHWLVVLPWMGAVALLAASYGSSATWFVPGDYLPLWAGGIMGGSMLLLLWFGGVRRCWTATVTRRLPPTTLQKVFRPYFDVKSGSAVIKEGVRKAGQILVGDPSTVGREDPPGWWLRTWVKVKASLVIGLAAIVTGAVTAGLTWVLLRTLAAFGTAPDERAGHSIALGTAGLLSVVSLAIVAMLGMLGEKLPDEHREWWSRFRTCLHLWAMAWLAAFVVALYVPWGFQWLHVQAAGQWPGWSAFVGWVGSTVFGVWKGQTAEDDVKREHEAMPADVPMSTSMTRLAAAVAPYVFIVGLVVAIAVAIDRVYVASLSANEARLGCPEVYWEFVRWSVDGWRSWAALAGLTGLAALFSWRVDINDFSLHHFYKNRLVRCYLGASHGADRQPDWFTGFDPHDDVRLEEFDHERTESAQECAAGAPPQPRYPDHTPYAGPYPILNCALNLVGGEDLAWQERKSASFVFTPKYCGYDVDRAVLTKKRDSFRLDAYVPTVRYYHPGEGPLLGMAMAISGAAANPNMGRASSPALAFLLTVFNVRLGWWLRNPRHKDGMGRRSPLFGLPYTALELFGGTDDRRKFVNVSDGGHFENLGVYELIRRGCRYIVVCDAGQDERFTCEDLGILVRLCRTDFGVEIDIDVDRVRRLSESRVTQTHCVVGKIHYLPIPARIDGRLVNEDDGPLLRGTRPGHEVGYLLYIKTSLTGDEPQDVLEYSRRIPRFPHQSTADQWFDESQFESYRKLGIHVGETAFGRYQDDDTKPLADVGELFVRLYDFWHAPAAVINERSTELTNEYTRLLEKIHADPKLAGLDKALFEDAPAAAVEVEARDEIFVCNSLIQLMENVYAELELERLWRHPHVKGWMSVFERWAQRAEFRRTWRIVELTYAERFRNFYNDRLKGRPLALPRLFVAGHRGVPTGGGVIENTQRAFDQALARGANVIELDVRRLACGTLVVWHDDDSGGVAVSTLTLDELRQRAPEVTTLDACAESLRGRVQLAIELKVSGLEADVCRTMSRHTWRRRDFVIMAFDRTVLENVARIDTSIRTGWLVDDACVLDVALERKPPCATRKRFLDVRADFLAPNEVLLDDDRLAQAARLRIPLVPWTVNDPARLARLICHEATIGVITDDVTAAIAEKHRL